MEPLITGLILSLGINLLIFIPAYFFKTDKLTDISYSVTFIVLAVLMIIYQNVFFASILIIIWALRLGTYLLIRIFTIKKDKRFDTMRASRTKFIKFWILQGISVWVILLPFLLSINNEISLLGVGIRIIGLLIETIADYQKFRFKSDKNNKRIDTGLRKYSRHPNYFGEILCWIGIYVAVLPSLSFTNSLLGLISPVYIILLLLFVSGIPLLEKNDAKKRGQETAYKNYVKKTSILVPWFTK
ncbi:MAG TPA: DUF1295 domain-containing protein [Candidatus Absconditabacterales bacterium]|nr:DUF1295 domain-containing protein [Candidatus Absconditabacterales bacterium]